MLIRSPYGTVLRAIGSNEHRMSHFGYNITRLKTIAFVISGAVSGLAGALFAAQFNFVSPSLLGFILSTQVLIWVAVGGRSVLMASVVGAIIVPRAERFLSNTIGNLWQLFIDVLFIFAVLYSREGVLGKWLKLRPHNRLQNQSIGLQKLKEK